MSESGEVVMSDSDQDKAIWQDKYQRLLEQFVKLQRNNQELEEKLLNVVEKTEREKILLSEEIDEISRRLTATSNHVAKLENECARYKSDCVLAVHLLQCQPSSYVAQKLSALPDDVRERAVPKSTVFKDDIHVQRPLMEQNSKKLINVSSHSTFPPTAIYYNPDEYEAGVDSGARSGSGEEQQPEDPLPKPPTSTADSLQQVFVDKIRAEPDYSCVELKQCKTCGLSLATVDKCTQTMHVRKHSLGHSVSASALVSIAERESVDLIRLSSESEVDEESSVDNLHTDGLKMGQIRIRSADSEMSTDTPI